jgi:hypothetical protein
MSPCNMAGCDNAASGYSNYCEPHKKRQRRHGHPGQSGVTVYELRPLQQRVRVRIEKNIDNPTWPLLRDRWALLIKAAKDEMTRYQSGKPMNRYEIDAWANLETIGAAVTDIEVIETVLAMYLLQEDNPRRFMSDDAFSGQLVRRVRSLALSSAGEYYDHKTGKTKRVYRDAKPKTVTILAGFLQHTFGAAGLIVARLEQREMAKKNGERMALHSALEGLK